MPFFSVYEETQTNRMLRQRAQIMSRVFVITFVCFGIVLLLFMSIGEFNRIEMGRAFLWLLPIVATFTVLLAAFYRGVSGSSSYSSLERRLSSEIDTLRSQVDVRFKYYDQVQFDEKAYYQKVEELVSERISREFDGDVVKLLGKKVAQKALDFEKQHAEENKRKKISQSVEDIFNTSYGRLNQHAQKAQNSSLFFVICGFVFAILGIVLTFYNVKVFYDYLAFMDMNKDELLTWNPSVFQTIFHVPVSIPFIILSEIFALIMFRYYSKSMERMRYYTNEVTTLQLMFVGMKMTIEYGSPEDISKAAFKMIVTERNKILSHGSKTIEIEQNNDESQMLSNILDILPKIQASHKDMK